MENALKGRFPLFIRTSFAELVPSESEVLRRTLFLPARPAGGALLEIGKIFVI